MRPVRRAGLFFAGALLIAVGFGVVSCQSDDACRETCNCQQRGLCGREGKSCKATEPEHCLKSDVCRIWGHCTVREGACVAGRNEDCFASENCKKAGRCTARDGSCVR
jgi:hypothetical protein